MHVPGTPSGAGFLDPRELSTPSLLVLGLGALLFAVVLFAIPGSVAAYLATLWVASVLVVRLRPAGGGQLAALLRWARLTTDADLNPSLPVLAVEVVAVALFVGGGAGVVVVGIVARDPLWGPVAMLAMVAAAALWLLAWLLEGLSLTASNPYRDR